MKKIVRILVLVLAIAALAIVNLLIGSVQIPVDDVCRILVGDTSHEIWYNIVWKSRLPQVLTAIVAGAGLAVSGLQMQTVFRNPLAGPSVLGISNGSALGVAFVVLLSGRLGGVALSRLGYLGEAAMSVAAIVGALSVMLLIMWIAQRVKGNVTLLIIGVMIGYLANAIIGVLKFLSPEEDVKAFVVWGLGSFSRVSGDEMVLFVVLMAILIPLSFLLVKSMNLLLLGDKYAANLGLNIRRSRMLVILSYFPLVRSSHLDASHGTLWRCSGIALQFHSADARIRGSLTRQQCNGTGGCTDYSECIVPSSAINRRVSSA